MPAPMSERQYAVYIATTQGPVRVQHIDYEDEGVLCHIGVEGSTRPEPITRDYRHFVDRSSGLVARRVGHDAFRVSLSDGIEQGNSWQAGLYIAHILKQDGQLAEGDSLDQVDGILWLTGEVRAGEKVAAVNEVTRKFDRSQALFSEAADQGLKIQAFVPADNADAIPDGLAFHINASPVSTIADIETAIHPAAASMPEQPANTQPEKSEQKKTGYWPALLMLAGAVMAAAYIYQTEPELLGFNKPAPLEPVANVPSPTPPAPEPDAAPAPQPVPEPAPNPAPAPLPDLDEVDVKPYPTPDAQPAQPSEPIETAEPPAPEPDIPAPTPQPEPDNLEISPELAMPLFRGQAFYRRGSGKCLRNDTEAVPIIQRNATRFAPGSLENLCGLTFTFEKPAPGFVFSAQALALPGLTPIGQLSADTKSLHIPAPRDKTKARRYSIVVLTSPADMARDGQDLLDDYIANARFERSRINWIAVAQDLAREGHHLSVITQRLLLRNDDF